MIGGLIWALLLNNFSFAQTYGPTESDLLGKSFKFLMPSHSLYLYAITAPNTYTIHFDGNGSTSWNMDTMNMIYGEKENLLANNFIKDWFVFQWWASSESWEVEYLDQEEVSNLTTVDSWEVILYAQRTDSEVPYIVEYYQENLAWTWYDLVETGAKQGPAGPQIITTWQTYTWFTLQTWTEVTVSSGGIVPYYYTRNTYNLTVNDRENTLVNTWIKYWADIPLPADPEWTWNTFEWWDNLPWDGKMPADDLVITSTWSYGMHTITFDTDWWTEVAPITANYGDAIEAPASPTKDWYEFVRWEPALPSTMPYDDITLKAIWKEASSSSGWSGRWWRWWSSDESPTWGWDDEHGSATDQTPEWNEDKSNMEVLIAYMWARNKWILETTRKNSDPDGYIPRWDMAEMVVKFTENVLWRQIPSTIPAKCAWWDAAYEWKSPETKLYAQKACALWVMWIRMKNFMPNKLIDRAEFWTILSRLLWWDTYDVVDATKTNHYYARHLAALNERKIMTQIANPEDKKELRKWAWLMLMRSRELK